jgi:hypothetical protein
VHAFFPAPDDDEMRESAVRDEAKAFSRVRWRAECEINIATVYGEVR